MPDETLVGGQNTHFARVQPVELTPPMAQAQQQDATGQGHFPVQNQVTQHQDGFPAVFHQTAPSNKACTPAAHDTGESGRDSMVPSDNDGASPVTRTVQGTELPPVYTSDTPVYPSDTFMGHQSSDYVMTSETQLHGTANYQSSEPFAHPSSSNVDYPSGKGPSEPPQGYFI